MRRVVHLSLSLLMTSALLAVEVDPPSDATELLPPANEIFQTTYSCPVGFTAFRSNGSGSETLSETISWERVEAGENVIVQVIAIATASGNHLLAIDEIEQLENGILRWTGTFDDQAAEGSLRLFRDTPAGTATILITGDHTLAIWLDSNALAEIAGEGDDEDPAAMPLFGWLFGPQAETRLFACSDHVTGEVCESPSCCASCRYVTERNSCLGCCDYFHGAGTINAGNCRAGCPMSTAGPGSGSGS